MDAGEKIAVQLGLKLLAKEMGTRALHLPTTGLGAVAAGAFLTVWKQMPANCQAFLKDWQGWGVAVVLFLWGALSAGPQKPNLPPEPGTPAK